jgi:starch synthase
LHKFAIDYADAVVQGSADIDKNVLSHIKFSGKPFMKYPGAENYIDAYQDFYEQFIEQEEDSEELEEEAALTEN